MRKLLLLLMALPAFTASAQRSWLRPDFATLQYAGSIGFISGGVGYDVLKKHQLSLHYGYVPKTKGGRLNIIGTKLIFNITAIDLSRDIMIQPFNAGVMISYHLGEQFRSRWPAHRYPDGYYWWKTSVRAHLLVESAVTFKFENKAFRSITGFVEFNTNELYLISFVKNTRSLSLTDIVKVGYGLRARF